MKQGCRTGGEETRRETRRPAVSIIMASGVGVGKSSAVAVGVGGGVVVGTVALDTHPTTTAASKSVIPHPDLTVLVLICIFY